MKNKKKFLTLALLAALACGVAFAADKTPAAKTPPVKSAPAKVFNAETMTLENGLQVVVIPNHRAPVITHMVWYKTGAADEAPGRSGIAHFLEHLMFKGSEGLAPGEFSQVIKSLGGNDNAFTTHDYTGYHQSIAAKHLEKVMQMEAGRMRGLKLEPEQVASELKVILEERRQRVDNDPRAQFNEQMSAALYINHPYGTPVIGWMHEMQALTQDYARDYYDHHYGPNNAILVVSGDVTGQQVFDLAKKIYGPLARVEIPPRQWLSSPPLNAKIRMESRRVEIRQGTVQKLFRAPGYRKNPEQSLALQVLAEIMGGGPSSRLYKELVIKQKLATGANLSYQGNSWDDTEVWVSGTLAPGIEADTLDKAIDEQLRLLANEGITPEELQDAKTRMQAAAIYARDSLAGPAMIFGSALASGETVDDVEYWPQKIAGVTVAQVQEAAKSYLDPDSRAYASITGYLLPAPPTAPKEEKKP